MLVFVGRDFFPFIDGGQIQLHVRAPAGTRIEATEKIFQAVEDKIREIIPESERALIVDNIGLPARAYNLAFADGSTIGVNDGTILVSLKEGHAPTAEYVRKLREALPAAFPENVFYFQAADIVTQILNFGLPAQIDVRTVGYDRTTNLRVAKEMQRRIAAIPGIADAHLQQEVDAPAFYATIDRARRSATRPQRQHDRHQPQYQPEFIRAGLAEFLDRSDLRHSLLHRGPDPRAQSGSLNDLANTPVSGAVSPAASRDPRVAQQRGDLQARAPCRPTPTRPTSSRSTMSMPAFRAAISAASRPTSTRSLPTYRQQLSPGNSIQIAGQIQSMNDAFRDLGIGLLFAAVFVYLLMVVNYQNFGDPLVVILALPATFCGILTMLFITGTTLNVPSLMGAIMAVGVASANSILLVTFAREQQLAGRTAFDAAIDRRPYPDPPGAHDRGGDDRRHDPDGDRRRRRGAECRAGARRHRRPAVRHSDDPADRAVSVRSAAQGQRRQGSPWRIQRGCCDV